MANVPVMLWGEPGIGKTQSIRGMVEAAGGWMYTLILANGEPSDTGGIPFISKDTVKYAPHEWAQEANESAAAGKLVVVFVDEFNTAPVLNIASALTMIQDRLMGGFELHPEVRFVMASNPPETSAGGRDLPAPAANRMLHLDWTPDSSEYTRALLYGWEQITIGQVTEESADAVRYDMAPMVAGFLTAKPHLLLNVPNSESEAGRSWPSPRSWDNALRVASYAQAAGFNSEVVGTAFVASIGDGAAGEYLAYARDLNLPNPEDILANPDKAEIPNRTDQLFTVLGTLVRATISQLDGPRSLAFWTYLNRVAKEVAVDAATVHAAEFVAQAGAELNKLPSPGKLLEPFAPILAAAGYSVGK
jgi:hypothetical protein